MPVRLIPKPSPAVEAEIITEIILTAKTADGTTVNVPAGSGVNDALVKQPDGSYLHLTAAYVADNYTISET